MAVLSDPVKEVAMASAKSLWKSGVRIPEMVGPMLLFLGGNDSAYEDDEHAVGDET